MKKNTLAVLVLVLILGGYLVYDYVYKDHRNIANEEATYTVTASKLIEEFATNSETAQTKYLDKTIAIDGSITSLILNTITLSNTVFCSMATPVDMHSYKTNQTVQIKGRFIGYDELLNEIKLDQCILIN